MASLGQSPLDTGPLPSMWLIPLQQYPITTFGSTFIHAEHNPPFLSQSAQQLSLIDTHSNWTSMRSKIFFNSYLAWRLLLIHGELHLTLRFCDISYSTPVFHLKPEVVWFSKTESPLFEWIPRFRIEKSKVYTRNEESWKTSNRI